MGPGILGAMATIYYTASSLDGFIVDSAGSLDWLLSRDIDVDGPFGYKAFEKSVGALVMGSTTYRWVVEHGDWNPKPVAKKSVAKASAPAEGAKKPAAKKAAAKSKPAKKATKAEA